MIGGYSGGQQDPGFWQDPFNIGPAIVMAVIVIVVFVIVGAG